MKNVKKNFGFGCMRLPLTDGEVDKEEFCKMIDMFIQGGFNYFDTAHGYVSGKSEAALNECLVSRYKRDEYILTNKLSTHFFKKNEEILPLFESQLSACGVDYFDYYLMHAQSADIYKKFKDCHAYETVLKLKDENKLRHFGISFHDKADVLEMILKENPQIEVVQIQFNYVDYNDPSVESRKCYEVCRKYGKTVIVMEPIKGGSLLNLPQEALDILRELKGGSPASYALRFAASFPGIEMVLSGMSNREQLFENIGFMDDFKKLSPQEFEALEKVCEIFAKQNAIACTACEYCLDECPEHIKIPDLFSLMNAKKLYKNWNTDYYYHNVQTVHGGKASDCIGCGKCERICPQHLKIRELLKETAAEFEAGR